MNPLATRSLRLAALASGLLASLLATVPALAQSTEDPDLTLVTLVDEALVTPTAMAFVGPGDLLVLEKSGSVRRVLNGVLQPTPVLNVAVNNGGERGLLGIAVNSQTPPRVFLFYTEAETPGGSGTPIGNRVYRYIWNAAAGLLESPQLVLDLPVMTGSNHNGGALLLGPPGQAPGVGDGALLYAVIGDLEQFGKLQNHPPGPDPNDTGVILRVRQDGTPAPGNPFTPYCSGATTLTCSSDSACGASGPCLLAVARYYAYGVRNSFGLAIDPLNGRLWDTENGPGRWDEVNRVAPGFNSGWYPIMGPDASTPAGIGNLWNMPGAGSTFSDPEFSWYETVAPTAILFSFGSRLGRKYDHRVLVGDYNLGLVYALPLDAAHDGFDFTGYPNLVDSIADTRPEAFPLVIGLFPSGVTDLEIGPDGALYVLEIGGSIHRITGPEPAVPALSRAWVALLAGTLASVALLALSSRRAS